MTVKQLIERLQQLPEWAEVNIDIDDWDWPGVFIPVTEVEMDDLDPLMVILR